MRGLFVVALAVAAAFLVFAAMYPAAANDLINDLTGGG